MSAFQWPTFRVLGQHDVQGRGLVVHTNLDKETATFSHLVGKVVVLIGLHPIPVRASVRGVEHQMHAPPYRAGAPIGLLVDVEAPHADDIKFSEEGREVAN